MKRLLYELYEGFRIALAQIRANKMRSALTALGVIIGIVAVTMMGTAIMGIDIGFNKSLAMLGDDMIYVQKMPWGPVQNWWKLRNRPRIQTEYADELNRIIANTPDSLLDIAVPAMASTRSVRHGEFLLSDVYTQGTTYSFDQINHTDLREGRFFSEPEARAGRDVCLLGYDVADALFPRISSIGSNVLIGGHRFKVIGVFAKQGAFLGLFSFDNQVMIPLTAYKRYFSARENAEIRVKVKDKTRLAEAKEELDGDMRRVRGLMPEQEDNFSLNEQQAFKSTLGPIKNGIAIAGLAITGLSLFVGAIGIMNITFVSVKERTREIGTRKALGARRRTILLQFLIEAVSICLVGGLIGLLITFGFVGIVRLAAPGFPVAFSPELIIVSVLVATLTGVISGFAPAWMASRLDPVEALRYE